MPYFFPLYGGGETQAMLLLEALASAGHEVTVFTGLPPGAPSAERCQSATVLRFGSTETPDGLRQSYEQILRHLQPRIGALDLLYLPFSVGEQYPVRLQAEVVRTALDAGVAVVVRPTSSNRVTQLARLDRESLQLVLGASAILALNEGIRAELRRFGVPDARILRIHNGVADQHFTPPGTASRAEIRRSFGIAPEAVVGLCVGRFNLKKRFLSAVADWEKLVAAHPGEDLRLVIIGDDKNGTEDAAAAEELRRAAAASSGRIRLLAPLPYQRMPAGYAIGDILLSYSLEEGMSNCCLEAMACGLPLVVPDTAANEPFTRSSGNFVFGAADEALGALRTALAHRLRWPEIGRENRLLVEREFAASVIYPAFGRALQAIACSR